MSHDPISCGKPRPKHRRNRCLAWFLALALFVTYLAITRPVFGAEIVVDRASDPAIVLLAGTLTNTDNQKFVDSISGIRKAIVILSSDGGSVTAGISIGKTIRLRNFMTAVPTGIRCASACALAWLGGTTRYMSADALVGFHAAYIRENGNTQESGVGNALIGSYLANLGLSDAAVVYVTSAHPDEIQWLTVGDAQRYGIDVALMPPMSAPSRAGEQARPRPPAEKPSRPASTLDDKVRAFVTQYFGRWSDTNYSAMIYMRSLYADQVDFYGKTTPRATIVDLKQRFVERWPERAYVVRASSLTLECDQQKFACVVTGLVDWECRSPARGARSAGLANFTVGVVFDANGSVTVYREDGSVVTRAVGQ